jgi:nicotinamide mononucleotide adenylyltransferase
MNPADDALVVHGRFQVFHLDHARYLDCAFRRSASVEIGLTGLPGFSEANSKTSHRFAPSENPLTYHERVEMITIALAGSGIDAKRFSFVPFPIEQPALLPYFVGPSRRMLTTIREPWNEEKVKRLRAAGYEVEIAYTNLEKSISGSLIRRWIQEGDPTWKRHVSEPVARYLESIDIAGRLKARK